MKKISLFLIAFFLFSSNVFAVELRDRSNITDWYIKDFKVEIDVNSDRSLNITEYIIADCGNLPNKHGIFRNVPKSVNRDGKVISLPLNLKSITDFSGNVHNYYSSFDIENNVQTWKIGDANVQVKGENEYKIVYEMRNVVYTLSEENDEFYWNILGAFWNLEIDNFEARLRLPEGLSEENVSAYLFSGSYGEKNNLLDASMEWGIDNELIIRAVNIDKREAITVSLIFPKGFVQVESLWSRYLSLYLLVYLIPFLFLVFAINAWKKHGRNFKDDGVIVPVFYPPKKYSILEMGTIWKKGKILKNFLSAEIINLAVKGFLTIEKNKGFWIFNKNIFFNKVEKDSSSLLKYEKLIYDNLFIGGDRVSLIQIRNRFGLAYEKICKDLKKELTEAGYINKKSLYYQSFFLVLLVFFAFCLPIFLGFWLSVNEAFKNDIFHIFVSYCLILLISLIFNIIMPQRTEKASPLVKEILGFKMYMDTAEKHRQKFNEKENIFEKYLPFAIFFGISKMWMKKFRNIYGDDYFKNHPNAWLIGSGIALKDLSSLSNVVNTVSRDIGSNIGSSSSSSGGGSSGGSSGGGGGGGGGGGW